jgi:phosphoribosyl 1,2-cyclic phosphodiesterase
LIEVAGTCLMVDCGFSIVEMERRLMKLAKRPEQIAAILVTHEHSDHVQGVARFARKYSLPLWMTPGTYYAREWGVLSELHLFDCHEPFAVGDVQVLPIAVPHDAREPSQFVFDSGAVRLALLTDTGSSTRHLEASISGVDALVLECNHDSEMLARGSYPPQLKRRVGGEYGHLSNRQAAELLSALDVSRLQHLVAAHLSQQNNAPELARKALSEVLGCSDSWVQVACQNRGLAWRQIR